MLTTIRTAAIAAFGFAAVGLAGTPAAADGYDHGRRWGKTVRVTKTVIHERRVRHGRHYGKRHGRVVVRRTHRHAGPPRWAPAHGYRRHAHPRYWHDRRHRHDRPRLVRRVIRRTVHVAPRHRGHVYTDRTVAGGLIGAALGALTGSHIGKGGGRTAAIVGGAVVGALVGGNIGQAMDRTDYLYATRALETAPTGNAVAWTNPDTGYRYTVTPTRTYQRESGQYCREYTTWGWVGGYEQQLYGTACRMADGSWRKVS